MRILTTLHRTLKFQHESRVRRMPVSTSGLTKQNEVLAGQHLRYQCLHSLRLVLSLISMRQGEIMANLLVRGVDDTLVQSLRELAAAHGRSSEAEHREILARALRRPKRKSFAEVL